jgi:predicted amidohydrolase YtcJ
VTEQALIIRNVEVGFHPGQDVHLSAGRIAAIGRKLPALAPEIDGRGGAVIPGLIDHHIHLLATAAQAHSLHLDGVHAARELADLIAARAATLPHGEWLRATGYHERMAGLLARDDLDFLAPHHPIRVQHQSGALWMLNSRALDRVLCADLPDCVERGKHGHPTGRIWRGDAWLRGRIASAAPPLAALGAELARLGITGVTDATATTDDAAAGLLAQAHRDGALPQHLTLMGAARLAAPDDAAFTVGPVKIVLDDRDLPPLDDMLARIEAARSQQRAVAVHCVTDAELAFTLAAFESAGSRPGDRLEHGGMIPSEAIPAIAALDLMVVTQPAFPFERGDRYLDDIHAAQHGDLYRCASLRHAGIHVAASSDAPYTSPDPWAAMRAATRRRTRAGRSIGAAEAVSPAVALNMFLGPPDRPGGPPRHLAAGAPADLVLLRTTLREALCTLNADLVAATFISGRKTVLF